MTTVTHLADWSRQTKAGAEIEEHSFASVYELTAFVQAEIVASKLRYKKIAELAGVCPSTVSKMAYGQTYQPRAATCLGILAALGWTIAVGRCWSSNETGCSYC
jgi:hypothetical protein